jgi:hypothetical protein
MGDDGATPFATVQAAIDFADQHRSQSTNVCVAQGAACGSTTTYPGPSGAPLSMKNGISVYGDYESSGWTRCSQAGTTLAPATATGVLFPSSVQSPTVLDGFSIELFGAATTTGVTIAGARGASVNVAVPLRSGLTNVYGVDVSAGAQASLLLRMSGEPYPGLISGEAIGVRATDSTVAIAGDIVLPTAAGATGLGILLDRASGSSVAANVSLYIGASLAGVRIVQSDGVTLGGRFQVGYGTGASEAIGIDVEDSEAISVIGAYVDVAASFEAQGVRIAQSSVSITRGYVHVTHGFTAIGVRVSGDARGTTITESSVDVTGQAAIVLEDCDDAAVLVAENPMIRLHSITPGEHEAIRVSGACHPRIESNTIRVDGPGIPGVENRMTAIACLSSGAGPSLCEIVDNDVAITSTGAVLNGPVGSVGISCAGGSCDAITGNRVVGQLTGFGCRSGCFYSGAGVDAGSARIVSGNFIQSGCSADGFGLSASGRVENNVIIGPGCGANPNGIQPQRAVGLVVQGSADVHSNTVFAAGQLDRSPTGGPYSCVSTGIDVRGAATLRNNIVNAGGCEVQYGISGPASALEYNDLVPAPVLYYVGMTSLTTIDQVNALAGAAGNISQDPLLTSDFHLNSGSPCVDQGTPAGAPLVDLDGDGRDAFPDIGADERPTTACSAGNGGCDPRTLCTPLSGGGRTCGPCPSGFDGTGESGCDDIDECATNNGGCDPVAACVNLEGSFECGGCPDGYTGDGATDCVDIDECATENGGCDPLTVCMNVEGGRTCGPCPSGYSGDGESGCVDDHPFVELCLGLEHGCGLRAGGAIECWGDPTEYFGTTPPIAERFSQISCSHEHTCALRLDGTVVCWGGLTAPTPSGAFLAVSSAGSHDCGLRLDGTAECWGFDTAGTTPPPSGTFLALTSGGTHTCGLRPNYEVTCWGDDPWGATDVPAGTFSSVSAGGFGACGLRSGGAVECWGWENIPAWTEPPTGIFVAVSPGAYFGCAQRTDLGLTCWGDNTFGELNAPSGAVETFVAGQQTACAVLANDSLTCWGRSFSGPPPPSR